MLTQRNSWVLIDDCTFWILWCWRLRLSFSVIMISDKTVAKTFSLFLLCSSWIRFISDYRLFSAEVFLFVKTVSFYFSIDYVIYFLPFSLGSIIFDREVETESPNHNSLSFSDYKDLWWFFFASAISYFSLSSSFFISLKLFSKSVYN